MAVILTGCSLDVDMVTFDVAADDSMEMAAVLHLSAPAIVKTS